MLVLYDIPTELLPLSPAHTSAKGQTDCVSLYFMCDLCSPLGLKSHQVSWKHVSVFGLFSYSKVVSLTQKDKNGSISLK